jgi:predicted transcriptional regulator YheO
MNNLSDGHDLFNQLLTLIAAHFGDRCEVVLHDLRNDYNHTIVDIRNGHVTNRRVGGCGTNLGLEVLNGYVENGDRFNYVTTTGDGKILRSSSIYIKNDEGEVIGSLCINLDITESIHFESFLRNYNHFEIGQREFFAQDVNSLLDYLIQEAEQLTGKKPRDMNKEERLTFLSYLYQKGAFQISKAGIRICNVLGISKFTLYNDLDIIRNIPKEEVPGGDD